APDSPPDQAPGGDEHPVDMPHGAVERELSEEGVACGGGPTGLREADPDRDRQVEAAAVLAHLGRRQVDRHARPLRRPGQARVALRRTDALSRLLYRAGGEADQE